ncbi:MAG TPA: hypothetical protein VF746_01030 [Longimicrobium sp.]|jgi:hypothetical protein
MSDQHGIPAFTVFPPFNPAASRPAPAPQASPESAPQAEPTAEAADIAEPEAAAPPAAEAAGAAPWGFEPPAEPEPEPMPWDFGPADQEESAPAASAESEEPSPWETAADRLEAAEPLPWDFAPPADEALEAGEAEEEEELPWMELPSVPSHPHASEAPAHEPAAEADPDWMRWAGADEETAEERGEADVLPVADFAPTEPEEPRAGAAAPFAEEEEATDAVGEPWAPPTDEAPSDAESAVEWAAPEPAAAPEAASAAESPSASLAGAFDDVAERLEAIARALREDPQGFLAGGRGDPLSLLVTGFVLGIRARDAGNG